MAWPFHWPFRGHATDVAATRPTEAAAPTAQRASDDAPAWASLPPLHGGSTAAPLTAASGEFAQDVRASITPPLALAPLGHERSADGPAGLVSAAATPIVTSRPVVARSTAAVGGSGASGRPALANPFRRPAAVQRHAAAPAGAESEDAPIEHGAVVSRSVEGDDQVDGGRSAGFAEPPRRLAAVPAIAASSPAPSLLRAPAIDARVDGSIGGAREPDAMGSRATASLANPSSGEWSAASAPVGPAASGSIGGPAAHPTAQRSSSGSALAVPDARPARLSVGQVRRMGLGAPIPAQRDAAPPSVGAGMPVPAAVPVPATPFVGQRSEPDVDVARAATPAGDVANGSTQPGLPAPARPLGLGRSVQRSESGRDADAANPGTIQRSPVAAPTVGDAPSATAGLAPDLVAARPTIAPLVSRSARSSVAGATPTTTGTTGPTGDHGHLVGSPADAVRPTLQRTLVGDHDVAADRHDDPASVAPSFRDATTQRAATADAELVGLVSTRPIASTGGRGGPDAEPDDHGEPVAPTAPAPMPLVHRSMEDPGVGLDRDGATVSRSATASSRTDDWSDEPSGHAPDRSTPIQREVRPVVGRRPSLLGSAMPGPAAAFAPGSTAIQPSPTAPATASLQRTPSAQGASPSGAFQSEPAAPLQRSLDRPAAAPQVPLVLRSTAHDRTEPANAAGSRAQSWSTGSGSDVGPSSMPAVARSADTSMSAGVPSAGASVIQRVEDPAPAGASAPSSAPSAAAGPEGAASAAAGASGAAAATNPNGDKELDDLAHKLYDRLRSRIRLELLIDRERSGTLSDLG